MGGDLRQVGGDFLAKALDPEGPPPAQKTLIRVSGRDWWLFPGYAFEVSGFSVLGGGPSGSRALARALIHRAKSRLPV